ncbi:MAG TPA: hypothetical protein VN554_00055 [Verrucomicrobiae bacterium]|nr:hypothetical protein [Verrucomicrobiae bacterium]
MEEQKPPVMDVVPPPTDQPMASAQSDPSPAVQAVPPDDETPAPDSPAPQKAAVPAKPQQPTTPKQSGKPGVTTAIVATVVIVLGLAILATYAFLKTRS